MCEGILLNVDEKKKTRMISETWLPDSIFLALLYIFFLFSFVFFTHSWMYSWFSQSLRVTASIWNEKVLWNLRNITKVHATLDQGLYHSPLRQVPEIALGFSLVLLLVEKEDKSREWRSYCHDRCNTRQVFSLLCPSMLLSPVWS